MTATLFIRITAPVQGCLQLLPSFSGLYRSLFFLLKKKKKKVYAHDHSYLACLMIFISLPTVNKDNKKISQKWASMVAKCLKQNRISFPSMRGTFSLRRRRKTVNIIDHNAQAPKVEACCLTNRSAFVLTKSPFLTHFNEMTMKSRIIY